MQRTLEPTQAITIERVSFRGGPYRLEGEFAYPETGQPVGAVVVAGPHPLLGGNRQNNVVRGVSEGLAARGLATLRFDYRGVGGSEGLAVDVAAHLAEFWATGHVPNEMALAEDVRGAVVHLRRAAGPDLPLALVGYSFGCALLPHVALHDADRPALILVAPTLGKHDYDSYNSVSCPMLVIGSEDDFALDPGRLEVWVHRLVAHPRLILRRLDNHFFRGHEEWLAETIADFLAEQGEVKPMPASTLHVPDVDARLRDLLDLHFHPDLGSAYWLERQEQLGWDVRDRVRTADDLWLLGPTPPDDLRRHALRIFIPRALHRQLPRCVIGETAGTSGAPQVTAYRDDEFQAAFITPFLRVAAATGFPRGEPWLWVGPSGPHIIGKVVRELARQTGSMDPFSVDFDPRWAKRLAEGSLGRQRYLEHVTEQALDVLRREEVGVLFITPPALAALAQRLSDREREAIHGIHYGGMSLTPAAVNDFRAAFPRAVHLAGYGNTLFGVVMEVVDGPRTAIDYFPLDDRVRFHVVDWPEEDAPRAWPPPLLGRGEPGQVLFHRLDESCLLVGVVERDEAERIAPSAAARSLGGRADGLRNPRPPQTLTGRLQLGLY